MSDKYRRDPSRVWYVEACCSTYQEQIAETEPSVSDRKLCAYMDNDTGRHFY